MTKCPYCGRELEISTEEFAKLMEEIKKLDEEKKRELKALFLFFLWIGNRVLVIFDDENVGDELYKAIDDVIGYGVERLCFVPILANIGKNVIEDLILLKKWLKGLYDYIDNQIKQLK